MKVLIFSNIPSPYRIDFFNELGRNVELTVVFEARSAKGIKFNWNIDQIHHFKAIFLKNGDINEKKVDWSILRFIKKNQYDHIIVTSYAYLTEMVALIGLKLLKIPYYMEIDGGLIRKENLLKKLFKRFLVSNATGYLSPSDNSDDYLIHYGADKKFIYRYPFTSIKKREILTHVVSEDEKRALRIELGIAETNLVLAVGQFIHRKGFDVLLNTCKDLDSSTGVVFVGGIPTDEYTNLKEKYNLDNVYFKGFKSKKELTKYFKAADLFVLPTREDVWGLVINEAMAYGLPIVTTNRCIAGLELVDEGESGFIVEVDDRDGLCTAIKEILSDNKLRKRMSQRSLELINFYTLENMVKAHLKVLLKGGH